MTFAVLSLLVPAAFAQTAQDPSLNFEIFHPHSDLYGYSAVQGAATFGNLQLGGGFWVNAEGNPVVIVDDAGKRIKIDGKSEALVGSRLNGDVQLGIGITRYASLSLDLPIVLTQEAWDPTSLDNPTGTAQKAEATGLADLMITPKGAILDRDYFPVGLAVAVPLTVPTGAASSFFGEGGVTATPMVIAEYSDASIHARTYKYRAAINAGYMIRDTARLRDASIGNAMVYGIGIGAHVVAPLEITAEFHGQSFGSRGAQNPAEALVGVKALIGRWLSISAGGGIGVLGGVGAPDWRAYGGVAFAPSFDPAARDSDRDAIPDGMDKCAKDAEDKDGYQDDDGCPELDNDADGREDAVDQCPNDPEDDDGFMDNDGCPEPDNDKDGVNDTEDKCPSEAGTAERQGCPETDTDGDKILDELDRCPYDAEDMDGDRDEDGCPDDNARVVVEKERIRINDFIYFDTGKTTIQERSFDLLNEIAKVIVDNPQLLKIRIEGHTDDVGGDMQNFTLSQGRAKSVLTYLTGKGVDTGRLVSAGFGESMPLVPNDSEEHRAQNRRVEFLIVDQK